mmetsp:Transcript_63005/g.136963  ORF Transcript_63005/g.136963 Transcript_63005/m.136963 type:complete len:212 (-) Transcript_63005:191-826(-)
MQILEVPWRLQIRQPSREHHSEEVDPHVAVSPNHIVSTAAILLETLVQRRSPPTHDVGEIRCEDKGCTLPLHAELALEVAEEVAEVDMEEVAVPGDHDVVVVSVANAENERGHSIAGAAEGEGVEHLDVCDIVWSVGQQPCLDRLYLERPHHPAIQPLDVRHRLRLVHNLYEPLISPRGDAPIDLKTEVEVLPEPQVVHDAHDLQRQHILT